MKKTSWIFKKYIQIAIVMLLFSNIAIAQSDESKDNPDMKRNNTLADTTRQLFSTTDRQLQKLTVEQLQNNAAGTVQPLSISPHFQRYLDKGYETLSPGYFLMSKNPTNYGDYNTSGVIKQFRHSAFIGAGSVETVMGTGNIGNASVAYQQMLGSRVMLTVGANVSKTTFTPMRYISVGSSASLSYMLNDRLSFTAFGDYTRSMTGPYSNLNIGGFASIGLSNKFGLDIGANNYYDPMYRQWQTEPIVYPYFKLGGQKLGFDFGPLIKDMLINLFDKNKNKDFMGPMGPDRQLRAIQMRPRQMYQ
ncbi:MAG: hypothetical protein PHG06_20215 [Parabacteroides sp.]|nr:hypothetical protein [Parabacteroides sp.]